VLSVIRPVEFRTWETVAVDVPACRATSRIVTVILSSALPRRLGQQVTPAVSSLPRPRLPSISDTENGAAQVQFDLAQPESEAGDYRASLEAASPIVSEMRRIVWRFDRLPAWWSRSRGSRPISSTIQEGRGIIGKERFRSRK